MPCHEASAHFAPFRVFVAATTLALAAPVATMAQPRFSVLHAFGTETDGAFPGGALIQATDGNLYGTTTGGGAYGAGTFFKRTPAGAVTVLHEFFARTDGSGPGTLIQATDGNFYGATETGGPIVGTVFRMTPAGTITVLHSFTGTVTDGYGPIASLIQATDGDLYGTTMEGGSNAFSGTVFKITLGGTFTILHAFVGGADGASPLAPLIQATDGNFYGTTAGGGGPSDSGTVFRMTPAGAVTILHAFTWTDGATPVASLIDGGDGNLYGTTFEGGGSNSGTVFKMTRTGAVTILHAFATADGSAPVASLIQGIDGSFYGTARNGGVSGAGTVFKIDPAGMFTVLHRFIAETDGGSPVGSLIQATNGNLYGTTAFDGPFKGGTMFKLITVAAPRDFDGDGKTDIAVYRPSTGVWYIEQSSTDNATFLSIAWGISTDVPVPADYDGDGATDIAVYRPSSGGWYIELSRTKYTTFLSSTWGTGTDIPVPGDYDGDGKADLAVYRPSTGAFFILQSSLNFTNFFSVTWGLGGDLPVPGDFDGDGTTDIAIFRPSTGAWYVLQSESNYTTFFSSAWGTGGDVPLLGDFDGDGKTDISVFRPSTNTWFILRSSTNFMTFFSSTWGTSTDVPLLTP